MLVWNILNVSHLTSCNTEWGLWLEVERYYKVWSDSSHSDFSVGEWIHMWLMCHIVKLLLYRRNLCVYKSVWSLDGQLKEPTSCRAETLMCWEICDWFSAYKSCWVFLRNYVFSAHQVAFHARYCRTECHTNCSWHKSERLIFTSCYFG